MRGVIVGVDGSEESGGALDWVLREAADRAVPLTAVLAFESRQGPGDGPDAAAEEKRALVQEWLDAARARTGIGPDAVTATSIAERGSPAAVLLALAQPRVAQAAQDDVRPDAADGDAAALLVLGRGGRCRRGPPAPPTTRTPPRRATRAPDDAAARSASNRSSSAGGTRTVNAAVVP